MSHDTPPFANEAPASEAEALARIGRLVNETSFVLALVTGETVESHPFWAFVRMPPADYVSFKLNEMRGGGGRLADYGEILESGYGAEPPFAVEEEMRRTHGYDPQLEEAVRHLASTGAG